MDVLLQVEDVSKRFQRKDREIQALSHVSFQIETGQCMGLIGESGSGKSTLAGILAGFQKADVGRVVFIGKDLLDAKGRTWKNRQYMQMVFQNPKSSLNPRMKIRQNLTEAIRYYPDTSIENTQARCREVMGLVELPEAYLEKYPGEISGGECQRVSIARAIMRRTEFLICDEITSALDVSVQEKIVELLKNLQREYQMGLLFISHDIALVGSLCSHILVLKEGRIVESGETREVVHAPKDVYTKHLLDSVIRIEQEE